MVPSRDEAKEVLSPYMEAIRVAIQNAVAYYMSLPAKDRAELFSARSRASIIYDAMKREAMLVLSKVPNPPHMFIMRGQLCILIAGKFLMKLKKLDKRLRPSYIPTRSALRFMTHNANQPAFSFLDDVPPVTNLVAGYRWNDSETEADVFIVCPVGKDLAWDIPVTVEVERAVEQTTQVERQSRKRRVVAREIPVAKDGTGGDHHG